MPETTTRSGYRFMGWYDNPNFTGTRVNQVPKGSTGNKTFYANWSYLYTITFKNNGVAVKIMTGIAGEPIVLGAFNQSKVGHTLYWDGEYEVGYEYTIVGNKTFQAEWIPNKYEIKLDMQGGSCRATSITVTYGSVINVAGIYVNNRIGYDFDGLYTGSGGRGIKYFGYDIYDDYSESYYELKTEGRAWNYDRDGTLYAKWNLIETDYTYNISIENADEPDQYRNIHFKHGTNATIEAPDIDGYTFVEMYVNGTFHQSRSYTLNNVQLKRNLRYDYEVENGYSEPRPVYLWYPGYGPSVNRGGLFMIYSKNECIAEGSMITLADGTQKAVEDLTGNEMLLVWNLKTGTLDVAPILFIDSDPIAMYSVINLYFSDGTQVKVISEHGFWDYNLNKYVYLDKDAAQYIGHWFNKLSTDENGNSVSVKVQLVNVVIQDEYTTAWSPVTYGHYCYYVNGMLSMPGGIEGMFNIFEVDAETMKYDEAQMQADIAQYGLFTYEEFAELFPISQEVFEAFNGQYLKVAMGKGLIDAEGLQTLIERYAEFLSAIE